MARPTKYNAKLGETICKRIAEGESLLKVCKCADMPSRTSVHNWLLEDDKKAFLDKYEKSINIRTENMFDNLNEISDIADDNESPARSRLRVDTRKWYLSEVMPKKYGDKVDVTSGGEKIQGNTIIFKDFDDTES